MIELDQKRRNILKLAAFGGISFALGKILGPSLSWFSSVEHELEGETVFNNFRVVENGEEIAFYDKLGNEILILEKGDGQN